MTSSSIISKLATRLSSAKLPLLEATTALIEANEKVLISKLNLKLPSATSIWDNISPSTQMTERINLLDSTSKKPPSQKYYSFLKQLYPNPNPKKSTKSLSFDNLISKYSKINHDELFHAYQSLPSPAPLYMKSNDLEQLLKVFLNRRDFKYGHPALNWSNTSITSRKLLSSFRETVNKRKLHVERCSIIFNDIRKSNLPLSVDERNKLIGLNFFKDKSEIYAKIEAATVDVNLESTAIPLQTQDGVTDLSASTQTRIVDLKYLSGPELTWENYQLILQSFGNGIATETFNTILLIGIRHGNVRVVEDIYNRVTEGSIYMNRKTVGLLLDYFASVEQSENFFKVIDLATLDTTSISFDSQTVDVILDGLLKLNEVKLAQSLFTELYLSLEFEISKIYNLANFEDGEVYDDILYKFDKVQEILGETHQFKIYPTENTFYKFIQYSSGNSNDYDINRLVSIMEKKFGLMPSTRIYKQLFKSIRSGDVAQLQHISHMVVKSFNSLEDNFKKLAPLLTPKLRQLIDDGEAEGSGSGNIDNSTQQLKLTKDLMNSIFDSYVTVFESNKSLVKEILKLKDELWESELQISQTLKTRRRKDLVNELRFLRRAYLSELIETTIES